jgi:hypothetical protein
VDLRAALDGRAYKKCLVAILTKFPWLSCVYKIIQYKSSFLERPLIVHPSWGRGGVNATSE